MYLANINEDKNIANVNYIYENNAIYFAERIDLNNISDKVVHECIHYVQDVRNEKGKQMCIRDSHLTIKCYLVPSDYPQH